MELQPFFKELFNYGHYYNQRLADVLALHPHHISEKAVSLFSHMLNAHRLWNNRILPGQAVFGVWEVHTPESWKHIDLENYERSLFILDQEDLNRVVPYTNTQGKAFENTIRDMLFQAINHTTYHRAQIAMEFRQQGSEPLLTDFIVYKREGF